MVWGLAYSVIKIGVLSMPLTVMVAIRVVAGALAMIVIFIVLRRRMVGPAFGRNFAGCIFMALTSSGIPFYLLAWGEIRTGAGVSSLLNSTTPLWAAILATWLTPLERPRRLNYLGIGVGFAGTAVLIVPNISGNDLRLDILPPLAVIGAAASNAVSVLGYRRLLKAADPLDVTLWQLIVTAVAAALIAVPSLPAAHPQVGTVVLIVMLGVLGTSVAYLLLYRVLNALGGTRGSTVMLAIPFTAVAFGAILFHEQITGVMVAGAVITLIGIFLATRGPTDAVDPLLLPARPA